MYCSVIGVSDQRCQEWEAVQKVVTGTHVYVVREFGKSLSLSERRPALISHDLRVTWGAGKEERG